MDELRGKIAQVVMMGIDGLIPSKEVKRLIERGVGGIILYARNCHNPSQVAELIRELQEAALSRGLKIPLSVAIDQEHGPVTRIKEGVIPLPSPWAMGRIGDSDLVRRAARITGRELALIGINMNLAPVADILLHPQNRVIGTRSFGKDPQLVGTMVAAYIEGLQGEGVAACAKHFPGHGATETDSHQALPTLERSREEMEGAELIPFQRAARSGVAAIMTGHLLCPALDPERPTTLSPPIIQGLLRQDLGFEGVVISDDLLMGALSQWGPLEQRGVEALKAGVDLLLVGGEEVDGLLETLERGVATGEIPQARAAEAVYRILRLKEQYPYRGSGDLRELRQEEDLAFSQELFQG
ncbi:MAG: beta-N-acetylhexosaminidase [Deltaproteobacteria bacterium]|nr:beta-N-acetylhexosaminidase [Deltaproteobacteria bacterium]